MIAAENALIDNARRLAADAELLLRHDRNLSALVILILALEEVGKFCIGEWVKMSNEGDDVSFRTPKGLNFHYLKQCAAFCLYTADQHFDIICKGAVDKGYLSEEEGKQKFLMSSETYLKIQQYVREHNDHAKEASGRNIFSFLAASSYKGDLEKVRQLSIYRDIKDDDVVKMSNEMADPQMIDPLIRILKASMSLTDNKQALMLSFYIFEKITQRPSGAI